MMKQLLAMSVGSLLLIAGCTRWNMLKGPDNSKNEPVGQAPPIAKLVEYLDDNSSRMNAIRCTDLDMTCSVGSQRFGVRGKMIAQKPPPQALPAHFNFLMAADVFGSREVDLGSNNQEFWWWIKKNDPPYQYFCLYKDLENGQVPRIPFPFQPDWIVQALGMGNYGPAKRYTLEVEGDKLKLVEKARSPQGQPVRKVIVMNRRRVRPPAPQVTAFLLLDDVTGQEICSAHISEVQVDSGKNGKFGILPRKIEFLWSMPNNQTLGLAMRLDGLTMNPDIDPTTFARRPLQGVPSYDLATGKLVSLQQAQGLR
jgi:hypothetical protein